MANENLTCAICLFFGDKFKNDCENEVLQKVGTKGLNSLIESSKERQNNFYEYLESTQDPVYTHVSCRREYGSLKHISAAVKRKNTFTSPPTRSKLKFSAQKTNCDYNKCCVICNKEINIFSLKRDPVHSVTKAEFAHDLCSRIDKLDIQTEDTIALKNRLLHDDLIACEARYHVKCAQSFHNDIRPFSENEIGSPASEATKKAMETIFKYVDDADDCQFSYDEFKKLFKEGEHKPGLLTIIRKLQERYTKDNLSVVSIAGGKTFFCLKESIYEMTKFNDEIKNAPDEDVRNLLKVVRKIRQEIRQEVFQNEYYPASDAFLNDLDKHIPKTLILLLTKLILPIDKKRWTEEKYKKISTAAHVIMSAARPGSFRSPLFLSLGVAFHRKFGNKSMIESLHSLGVCASYREVLRYERSIAMAHKIMIKTRSNGKPFMQYGLDNADFNTNTLTGKGTFHYLGLIGILACKYDLEDRQPIKRLQVIPLASEVEARGEIKIQNYKYSEKCGIATVTVEQRDQNLTLEPTDATKLNYLWMFLQYISDYELIGWNGFMEKLTEKNKNYKISEVIFFPFVNGPPSDYSTLYTGADYCVRHAEEIGMKTVIITCDQPLYVKMVDIVKSGIFKEKHVVARLGGFHCYMSFLGCIGYLMSGSGLKELLNEVFAENTINHMMTGKAYSKAVRAHILVQMSIATIVLNELKKSNPVIQHYLEALTVLQMYIDAPDIDSVLKDDALKDISREFDKKLTELGENNKTWRLWALYFKMVNILKDSIYADRSGDWSLHLESIEKMIPFFHTCGHFPYAKAATLYLQDMRNLKNCMDPEEYEAFTSLGYWTVRRTDGFWKGLPTDQTIEQTLMKAMSVQGGPFSRGATNSVVFQWIQGTIPTNDMIAALAKYCGLSLDKSDQHKDSSFSRMHIDAKAVRVFNAFFDEHNPLSFTELASISTGLIADQSVDTLDAFDKGIKVMDKVYESKTNFRDIKLTKENKVITLQHMNCTVKIHDDVVAVDPNDIFQRILLMNLSNEELKDMFLYELSPFPQSLFDIYGFRKNTKSQLYDFFNQCNTNLRNKDEFAYIIDGGWLIHQFKWTTGSKFVNIVNSYVNFLKNNYGNSIYVVFDGYEENSIKSWERSRRSSKFLCQEYNINYNSKLQTQKEKFLSNQKNKNNFIRLLMLKLQENSIMCKQAKGDADRDIVETAVTTVDFPGKKIAIVCQDIDVLIILISLTQDHEEEFYFLKPANQTVTERQ